MLPTPPADRGPSRLPIINRAQPPVEPAPIRTPSPDPEASCYSCGSRCHASDRYCRECHPRNSRRSYLS